MPLCCHWLKFQRWGTGEDGDGPPAGLEQQWGVLRLGRQVGQSLEDGSRGLGLHPAHCGSLGKVFAAEFYCHFWKDLSGCLGIKMG